MQHGSPQTLGATWDGAGTNFALFSEHATRVELCLFDRPEAAQPIRTVDSTRRTGDVWHARVDVGPGQLYGYRVHGPYAPRDGHRFNPAKLLIDPYAKALAGRAVWHQAMQGSAPADEGLPDPRDSAAFVPKSIVIDPSFHWGDDRAPRTPWSDTLIYECHVKGLTAVHPDVPAELRGRYLGLASPPIIEHLRSLGVTAVELLPVQAAMTERRLVEKGLTNYWGYNAVGFFAPDGRFASRVNGEQVTEFQQMVATLHRAGLEVILDVAYNHTGEGGHDGPTVCFRGIDNRAYYCPRADDPARYVDHTGCGNTLNASHPGVARLIMDSLRYCVEQMHVDGFRLDLATTLGRSRDGMSLRDGLLAEILRDPVLSQVKLIAEPWDLGPDGYQLGRFAAGYVEWNDRYRDTVRRFWRGDGGVVGDFASRIAGSSDVFAADRGPAGGVNFVASHDGFTLRDVVSFDRKHNEANGEDNRDGIEPSFSRNWGAEGQTADAAVLGIRGMVQRSMLATLALSQGVPMLAAGDELGRTQRGNNNAYCQDNATSWIDWRLEDWQHELLTFAGQAFAVRRRFPGLRRKQFFDGATINADYKDVAWLRPEGLEMSATDWSEQNRKTLGMFIRCGPADPRSVIALLVLMNADAVSLRWQLPLRDMDCAWTVLLSSASDAAQVIGQGHCDVGPQCLCLLALERKEGPS